MERKAKSRSSWERTGPTHLTCGVRERNIYIQTQIAAGFSLLICLSVCLFTSFINFFFSLSPSIQHLPLFPHTNALISFIPLFLPHLFVSLLSLSFSFCPQLMSARKGNFHFISLSCSITSFPCEYRASPSSLLKGSHSVSDTSAYIHFYAVIC